jgi:ribulose-5-phosphate 4-epimerase/fuculose-1-phosphate aldolase
MRALAADPDAALRETVCSVGASLFQRGYAHATAGNISVRLPEDRGWLITPTDACLGRLDPARLAQVDAQGRRVAGDPASKTLALHRRIYAAAPAAMAVLHTHSTHLVALTLQGVWQADDILPPLTPYQLMKVGHCPLIPYDRPGAPAVAEAVGARIEAVRAAGTALHAVMLDRLGPMVWHRSLPEASALLEELEETARLWLLCGRQAAPLPPAAVGQLRRESGALW